MTVDHGGPPTEACQPYPDHVEIQMLHAEMFVIVDPAIRIGCKKHELDLRCVHLEIVRISDCGLAWTSQRHEASEFLKHNCGRCDR